MPGAAAFLHHLDDAAVLEHEVMGRNFAAAGFEEFERRLGVRHAGVVQHDHVRPPAVLAFAVIGRGHDFGNDAGIRQKRGDAT